VIGVIVMDDSFADLLGRGFIALGAA